MRIGRGIFFCLLTMILFFAYNDFTMHVIPYTPKENHPWRRYKTRTRDESSHKAEYKSLLYPFLKELVDNWETYDVGTRDAFSVGHIKNMSDASIALWLVEMLNKNFSHLHLEEDEYV